MALIHDFSNIAEANFNYAFHLILKNDYLIKANKKEVELVDEHLDKAKQEIKNSDYPFRDLWINLSLGTEILAKSVLINHQVDIFSKKNDPKFEGGRRIASKHNAWLEQILKSKDIEYVTQLNTGTLGFLYNQKIQELENGGIITEDEKDEIENGLRQLANQRRNNDLHFFFKQNAFMKESDLSDDYVPLYKSYV